MKQTCSIRDVALHVGVSPSTVSRVLNNRMGNLHVSDATRKRILTGARELNYTPNIHAKRLFSRRSKVIALVLPTFQKHGQVVFQDNHLVNFFSGVEQALVGTGYRLLIVFNDSQFAENKEFLLLFRECSIDGMLVWGACSGDTFWSELGERKNSVLFLTNPPCCDRADFNFILHDYTAAAREMLEYLVREGRREIGWIGGYRDNGTTYDQELGLEEVLRIHPDLHLFRAYADFKASTAGTVAEELLEKHPGLDAILVSNVVAAEGVRTLLQSHGVAIPDDIALAACDCAGTLETSDITRMAVDDLRLGKQSIECLLEGLLGSGPETIQEFLPVNFIKGDTA